MESKRQKLDLNPRALSHEATALTILTHGAAKTYLRGCFHEKELKAGLGDDVSAVGGIDRHQSGVDQDLKDQFPVETKFNWLIGGLWL